MIMTTAKRWKGAIVEELILLSNQGYKGSQIASILRVNISTLYIAVKNLKKRGVLIGSLGALAFQNSINDDVSSRMESVKRAKERVRARRYYATHYESIRARQREYLNAHRDEINLNNRARYYRARGWSNEDINKLITKA